MASNTSLIFVPGMCSIASVVFAPLIDELASKHNLPKSSLVPIDLPSCDAIATKADLKPSALFADIAAVRSTINKQIEAGRDVIVVAHSYGGTPALCATEGLWKGRRGPSEKTNGVVYIALISSSLPLTGKTVAGDRQDYTAAHPHVTMNEEGASIEQHGDEYFVVPSTIDKGWMPDLPADHPVRKSLRPSALSTVMTPVPETTPTKWKASYLLTTELDAAMPEVFQSWLVERAKEAGAEVEVKRMKAGHFVQISKVEEVGEWLIEIMK